ncbi:meiotically up-regulated protein [Ophiocordyceps camponoti-floridani]|uniref:Meiotically up-regulated protein n=1 Tax=Ophiocordyceps camponoti-floridani TaxID=2030778 RepID=A0A8H4Q814_9HYPO|nr:meiotically up-regulated protein [Ophiocordyceps camponoti-floridani]
MSMDDLDDVRRYQAPYGARRPVPTISRYLEEKAARQQEALRGVVEAGLGDDVAVDDAAASSSSSPWTLLAAGKPEWRGSISSSAAGRFRSSEEGSDGRNSDDKMGGNGDGDDEGDNDDNLDSKVGADSGDDTIQDTSQFSPGTAHPKQRRRQLRSRKRERAEREVTDPITHLPVTIHDFTSESLAQLDYNDPPSGTTPETATGTAAKNKSVEQLEREQVSMQRDHDLLVDRFPPPELEALGRSMVALFERSLIMGLAGTAFILWITLSAGDDEASTALSRTLASITATLGAGAAIVGLIMAVRAYAKRKMDGLFRDELWDAQRRQAAARVGQVEDESTAWLNSLLNSVWPLVNPDLFASLSDTLEDVMQASLPRLVRMVSIEDMGQGSEALRILGVRWLPTGAAARSVRADDTLAPCDEYEHDHDGSSYSGQSSSQSPTPLNVMAGEEGDFVNLEVAFAYRTRSSSKSLKSRTKDMHLYVVFYLPGNIKIPVWVDLQGIVGSLRLRLQLTPDPPFFALCTVSFMGQPKVDLSCIPLSRHGLNIMDVPLISNFVQSAVDAAIAEYVAPKSLTVNLRDMLKGDDFKKDTISTGVLMINIRRGYDFKMGDVAIPLFREGSSDPYVSVAWAKFGKVLWSTRVIQSEMEPVWEETCFVVVSPEELNIEERLRVQLWDSDRFTADDDLGRIEVPLRELLTDDRSRGRMWERVDGFRALKSGDTMPGKLEWSVGYFAKTSVQPCQFARQTYDTRIRSMAEMMASVDRECERKLRETMLREGTTKRDESKLKQLRAQKLKQEQDAMMMSAPPPDGYPSGLLGIQIHNITGLELDRLNKRPADEDDEASDEEETGENLPSSYCTIIINHSKTYKTRTKPQNGKPFFNAGCERFVRDWRECEVFISVRDARLREDNPLLGIVHLPLGDVFKERSQVMGFWPLTGGIGQGRIRLSLLWRSVELQAPRNLLGWSYGTLEVQARASSVDCPEELRLCKLKLTTNISMGKMHPLPGPEAEWKAKKGQHLDLAVTRRYSSCMAIAFKNKGFFGDKVAAFCVLWLKDVPDEGEVTLELPIWKGDRERAMACCLDECGERLGSLRMRLTFLAGMGNAHSKWASRRQNLRDVVEVMETARDHLNTNDMRRESLAVSEEASSDSDSSACPDDAKSLRSLRTTGGSTLPDGSIEHRQGPLDKIRDYRRRDKALHRQHRGVMQWKVPRTAKWVKNKFGKVGGGVGGLFDHQSRQAGIETEV